MEPRKLRFVRCPKCYQLLVEYPSIPVYKCGGCGTVLRAKNRAQPAVQARSEYDAQNNLPSSLKGSTQDSKPSCSDEHKTASSVDRPPEAVANGIISSPVNSTNSCKEATEERAVSVAVNDAPDQHQKEETCSLVDKDTQNPGVTVKEMQGSTEADSGSKSSGDVENLDTSEHANRVKVDKAEMSAVRTLDEKTEVVQREEKLHTYEGVHVESHEALIEELERSLSFSSDDDYFSDEAETSGLSDALCHQMGSRRYMFGGQMNDSSRNDPHGRLIEELEMSFSDVEEPMEKHAVGADRINGNGNDKHPQTPDAESANPCEESIPSLDGGRLESEKTSRQTLEMSSSDVEEPMEQHAVGADRTNGNEHDKNPQTLDAENANPCEESIPSLDSGHLESEKTSQREEPMEQLAVGADRINGNMLDKHPQTLDAENANPSEETVPSLYDGHLESEKNSHQRNRPFDIGNEGKEGIEHDNNSANDVHENEHDNDPQILGINSAHTYVESFPPHENGHLESEETFLAENRLIDNDNQGKEDIEGDNSTAKHAHGNEHVVVVNEVTEDRFHEKRHTMYLQHANAEVMYPCERSVSSTDASDMKFKQTIQSNVLTADDTQDNEEGCIDDGNMTNYIHGSKNVLFTFEDVAAKVHGNEEVAFDRTRENEENHVEDENPADSVHGKDICADEDVAEKVYVNEEVAFDRTGENEEDNVEDDNLANSVQEEDKVAVADERIAEKVDKNEKDKDQQSQEAEFSNSSHVKSEVIFKQKDLIADSSKQKEEDDMGDGNTPKSTQEDSTAVARSSRWSNKKTQCKLYSFNKKQEAPYKYGADQLRQGLSLDAKDFKSTENFIESQMDGTSSSVSSGSPCQGDLVHGRSNKFNVIARHERLKKMDELRDQLSRLSSQKSIEENYQKRGLEHQLHSDRYDVEQHPQSADVDSVPNSCTLESYYGYGRPPRYQPPNHFSPTHTYPRCDFGHAQARIPYNYDDWEFNSYYQYQSSYAESTLLDHDSMMSSYKEPKRVVRKHILRPLSGASPFSICNGCFNLIQMPSDMYISKAKVGKMQCGRCSKVIVLSFPAARHAEGKISVDSLQQSNKPAGSTVAKNKDATSHSAECLGGPVSINEEYGASFTRSFSQAAANLAATQSGKKDSDSALHRLMGYDSASQLLRHSRALDDGYDSFESMVPVSRRVNQRKNM